MSKFLADLLRSTGIENTSVLRAIEAVNRADFLPPEEKHLSEMNQPLPIGSRQTCSQPYIVARMSELLLADRLVLKNVLEIGTGSGYQAAILSHIAQKVVTIERIETLHQQARILLAEKGYKNINCYFGDGYLGNPNEAPYDGIMVTAASQEMPNHLLEQLDPEGGRLVIPIGEPGEVQELDVVVRNGDNFEFKKEEAVVFVPMLHGTN